MAIDYRRGRREGPALQDIDLCVERALSAVQHVLDFIVKWGEHENEISERETEFKSQQKATRSHLEAAVSEYSSIKTEQEREAISLKVWFA